MSIPILGNLNRRQKVAVFLVIFGSILVSAHTWNVDGGNEIQKTQEGMVTTIVIGSLMLFLGLMAMFPEGMLKKGVIKFFDGVKSTAMIPLELISKFKIK